jgi:hypothetical protein
VLWKSAEEAILKRGLLKGEGGRDMWGREKGGGFAESKSK